MKTLISRGWFLSRCDGGEKAENKRQVRMSHR